MTLFTASVAVIPLPQKSQSITCTIERLESARRTVVRIGLRYDVDYRNIDPALQQELDKAELLPRYASNAVYKVNYRGVPLAVKTEHVLQGRQNDLKGKAMVREELGQHHHIIKLVGTY